MCVWHETLHTSHVCPGYSLTLYLHCIPCAYLSRVSAPDLVAGWSIVWCHLGYISAFPQALAEFSSLHSDAKFCFFFFVSLYFQEIIFFRLQSIMTIRMESVWVNSYRSSVSLTIVITLLFLFSLHNIVWVLLFLLGLWTVGLIVSSFAFPFT